MPAGCRRSSQRCGTTIAVAFVCCFALLLDAPASAHTARHRVLDIQNVVVEFGYSDGSVMPYAEVKVFAPDQAAMPHQIGRTDAYGRFAFVPHQDGTWRLSARDDDSHAHEAEIAVTSGTAASRDWLRRGLLFASVFLNVALLAVFLDRYRKRMANGDGGTTAHLPGPDRRPRG